MKRRCVFLFLLVFCSSWAFAQGSKQIVRVSASTISQGDIKLSENLTTSDGRHLAAGVYGIAVTLDSKGIARFVLTPVSQPQNDANSALSRHDMSFRAPESSQLQYELPAAVKKNAFIRGVASVQGTFKIDNLTPSEAILSFDSKQFQAQTILGRPLDSKLVDLAPTFATIEDIGPCGTDCIEGFVKVIVRNDGNIPAKGKWNIVLTDRNFFVGAVTDVPAGHESEVKSNTKLRLASSDTTVPLDVEVHADFYNRDATDSNDANNAKRFIVNLSNQLSTKK